MTDEPTLETNDEATPQEPDQRTLSPLQAFDLGALDSAVVCAIGSNIGIPGVLARAAQALADAGVNVNCVSQTLRQVNMQFIVERGDYRKSIIALNHSLCVNSGTPVPVA